MGVNVLAQPGLQPNWAQQQVVKDELQQAQRPGAAAQVAQSIPVLGQVTAEAFNSFDKAKKAEFARKAVDEGWGGLSKYMESIHARPEQLKVAQSLISSNPDPSKGFQGALEYVQMLEQGFAKSKEAEAAQRAAEEEMQLDMTYDQLSRQAKELARKEGVLSTTTTLADYFDRLTENSDLSPQQIATLRKMMAVREAEPRRFASKYQEQYKSDKEDIRKVTKQHSSALASMKPLAKLLFSKDQVSSAVEGSGPGTQAALFGDRVTKVINSTIAAVKKMGGSVGDLFTIFSSSKKDGDRKYSRISDEEISKQFNTTLNQAYDEYLASAKANGDTDVMDQRSFNMAIQKWRTSVGMYIADYIKQMSGAAVSDQEYDRYANMFATNSFNNADELKVALKTALSKSYSSLYSQVSPYTRKGVTPYEQEAYGRDGLLLQQTDLNPNTMFMLDADFAQDPEYRQWVEGAMTGQGTSPLLTNTSTATAKAGLPEAKIEVEGTGQAEVPIPDTDKAKATALGRLKAARGKK